MWNLVFILGSIFLLISESLMYEVGPTTAVVAGVIIANLNPIKGPAIFSLTLNNTLTIRKR